MMIREWMIDVAPLQGADSFGGIVSRGSTPGYDVSPLRGLGSLKATNVRAQGNALGQNGTSINAP